MQIKDTHKSTISQLIKFGIVGLSNTIIGYLVYSLCIWFGLHYLIANLIGFIVSVLNAYYWSDRFVFKKNEGETRSTVKTILKTYIAYGSTGLLLASILLYFYVDILHFSEYMAQLLVLIVTIPINFIINKFWSFKTKRINEED